MIYMKKALMLMAFILPQLIMAQSNINLIPQPVSLKAGEGSF